MNLPLPLFPFFFGAALIWYSGTKLVLYVDAIGDRYGLGKAFLGALLLGGITSLPELSTTIVASSMGNALLAAGNLLGGVSMQTVILALVDLIVLEKALSYFSPAPVLIMGGVLLIFQLALAIVFITLGEIGGIWGVGLWSLVNFIVFLLFIYLLKQYEGKKQWIAADLPNIKETHYKPAQKKIRSLPAHSLFCWLSTHAVFVIFAGFLVSYNANRLIQILGLGSTFMGATFVALATSLPELSTTLYAVRLNAFTLAISNIFGSNALMVGLLFTADLVYPNFIFNYLGRETVYVSALGILVTALYLWGLLERKNKTILRMGIDSLLVIVVEIFGLIFLYFKF